MPTRKQLAHLLKGTQSSTGHSARIKAGQSKSKRLAELFDLGCYGRKIPRPQKELQFVADRRWRFDLAWPINKVALEVDGGAFMHGGGSHNRGASLRREHEKMNRAAVEGWRVLHVFPEDLLREDTYRMVVAALSV